MMLLVLRHCGRGFNPRKGTAVTFVGMIARRAARDISAQYAPPGRTTRAPSKRDEDAFEEFKRKSHVETVDDLTEDQTPAVADFSTTVDAVLDTAYLLSVAPAPLAHCLRRTCYDDVPMADAAAEVGLSRFQVHRMLSEFREAVAA